MSDTDAIDMDRSTVTLRDYLDVQFRNQRDALERIEGELRSVSERIDTLSSEHNELANTVVRHDSRIEVLEADARDARDFRRKLLIVGIPIAVAVVGYLLVAFIETFARLGSIAP